MLALTLWILLSVTACLGIPVAELVASAPETTDATIEPRDRNASWWRAKEKHYLRMPINRHVFNGTGRRGHHRKGPHVEGNPVSRRWGWEHLEDLGGIAYIIQRASVPCSRNLATQLTRSSRHRHAAAVGQGLHRHRLLRAVGQPQVPAVRRREPLQQLRHLLPAAVQLGKLCRRQLRHCLRHRRRQGAVLVRHHGDSKWVATSATQMG